MTRRSWIAGVVLVGTLAAGGALNRAAMHATFGMDDFGQRAMIEGTLTPPRGPFTSTISSRTTIGQHFWIAA